MNVKSIVESFLFVNEAPLAVAEMAKVLEVDKKQLEQAIEELIQEYKSRYSGIAIIKVAGGYKMVSAKENSEWVKKLYKSKFRRRLSNAALETLAIIAYRQPVTKLEIESIRGVNAEGTLKNLLEMGLVKITGRKEVVGRPFTYGTTKKFLEHFGLNSLKDLPALDKEGVLKDELKAIAPQNRRD